MTNPRERDALKSMISYSPGRSVDEVMVERNISDVIKMASNENPLGPAVGWESLQSVYERSHIYMNTYEHQPLCFRLASEWGVLQEQVILGNGSDEIIQMAALAFVNPGDGVITSEHTFSQYRFVAQLTNAELTCVPMVDYTYALSDFLAAVTPETKLICIANPNNPTGTYINHTTLVSFLDQLPSTVLVLLDEAYADYVEAADFPQSVELVRRYPNLLITRTFSKMYGLAALRIGYGVAQPNLIKSLLKVQPPFNVNSLAVKAALLALDARSHVAASQLMNSEGKRYFLSALSDLKLAYLPTEANFICILLPLEAKVVCDRLLDTGIIVRDLASFGLPQAIRVTIGPATWNQRFIEALALILKEIC